LIGNARSVVSMTMPPRPERLRRVTLAGYPQDGDKLVRWFLDGLDAYLLLSNGGPREAIISLGLLMRSNGLSIRFHGEPCSDPLLRQGSFEPH
jgi:hypothetical protein